MNLTQDLPATFQDNKHLVIKSFLTDPLLTVVYQYVLMKIQNGQAENKKLYSSKTLMFGYDLLMETLLEEMRPQVELATGTKLYPTFSFGRIYKKGEQLYKHTDRPACEVSVSLTLGSDGGSNWPIYLNAPTGVSEIYLNPGDAVVFRGREVEHWREPFDGEYQVQIFLHYVEQNGSLAEWRFDKRSQLGIYKQPKFKDLVDYSVWSFQRLGRRLGIIKPGN